MNTTSYWLAWDEDGRPDFHLLQPAPCSVTRQVRSPADTTWSRHRRRNLRIKNEPKNAMTNTTTVSAKSPSMCSRWSKKFRSTTSLTAITTTAMSNQSRVSREGARLVFTAPGGARFEFTPAR